MIDKNWITDNYYTAHPEKVLGEPYQATSRWKKWVTKYKGTRDDLAKINVPNYTVAGVTNVTISIENGTALPTTLNREQAQNVENALRKAKDEKRMAQIAKKAALRQAESTERLTLANSAAFFTFDEVDAIYNKNISAEEKQIFVWYQMRVLGRTMGGGWRKYHHNFTKEELIDAGKRGLVAYDVNKRTANFVPMFLYLSNNVFDKYDDLENQREKIKEAVGDEMFVMQYNQLKNLCTKLDAGRLGLHDPNAADRLRILPTSTFAESYKIKRTRIDEKFECRQILREEGYGQPDFEHADFIKTYGSYKHKKTFTEMSLQYAFIFWMIKNTGTIAFRKGLSWRDIYRLGVMNKRRYGGEDEDEFKKKKAYARVEAQRLFSIFLAEVILEDDRDAIERAWNRKYNCDVPLDYNRVPIGFPMARVYGGFEMDIKPEKREAIAFAMMQGSGCIAYGVGLGKTWCAAFIFAQFIENGWSQRPMLAVPNQVYKQFKAELNGILPHIFINDFYNLSNTEGYLNQVFDGFDYFIKADGQELLLTRLFESEDEKADTYVYYRWHNRNEPNESMEIVKHSFSEIQRKPKMATIKYNSISLVTYEGFKQIGLSAKKTDADFFYRLFDILSQSSDVGKERTEKERQMFTNKLDGIIGQALQKTVVNLDDMGIDMLVVDEAHSMKKVFTQAKGKNKKGQEYKLSAGTPSAMGIKGFMLSQYIQYQNNTGNVIFLTATPFTNSPLEVFSMLALVAYRELERKDLNNITKFFDEYANIQRELVINALLKPEYKEVFLGFENLPSLQKMLGRFFLYKQSLPSLQRPNKIILPMREKLIDGVLVHLPKEDVVDTIMDMTDAQESLMSKILQYAEGKIPNYEELCDATSMSEDVEEEVNEFDDENVKVEKSDDKDEKEAAKEVGAVAEEDLGEAEKTAIRLLRSMSFMRAVTLSPYLFKCHDLPKVDYQNYIESSAKLNYTMQCIKSAKEYHEKRNEPVSGSVIYMNRGVKFFEFIKEYLVKVVGFKPHEIGIIRSSMPKGQDKSWVQDRFLGRAYNEETRSFSDISDDERIKVLIGSATIREGLNLQKYGTTLYDLFLDFNPTDFEQLCGRIWRQGNMYGNVRIVVPLLSDSMDVFMFQKLQEKTSRINELWDFGANKSALSVEEFNPAELKYALMKDARRIAEIEVQERESNLADEKGFIQSELNILKEINSLAPSEYYVKSLYEDVAIFTDELKPLGHYLLHVRELVNMAGYVRRKSRLKDGLSLYGLIKLEKETPSHYNQIKKQYQQGDSKIYKAITNKGITFEGEIRLAESVQKFEEAVKKYKKAVTIATIGARMTELQTLLDGFDGQLKDLQSNDRLNLRAQQIEEERAANGNASHTIAECVAQFAKLNYLLSDMKVIQNKGHVPKVDTPSVLVQNLLQFDVEKEKILIASASRKRRLRLIALKSAA